MSDLSVCCDSPRWLDNTDICERCREHTDFYDDEEPIDDTGPWPNVKKAMEGDQIDTGVWNGFGTISDADPGL